MRVNDIAVAKAIPLEASDPPKHAIVLSVDEKSQIQALDRTQPGLPLKPGKAGTMTHDYLRHGVTTLFAAFDVLEGTVLGCSMQRHRHQEFLCFLNTIEGAVPAGKVIHVILDNYGSHKHPKVLRWLARHPRFVFHFTPTSGSWLNAIETFFSALTRRRIRRGSFHSILDPLLVEEFSIRENRRVKAALVMARLSTIKTLAGFDFTFQPALDRNRVLALAQLDFVDRHEVVHLLGPPGTGKSHLAIALGVEAVKAGRSVYFVTLADLVGALAKAEREGRLHDKIRFFCRAALLIVDEIGYLPVVPDGGSLFFQLVNARYERGAMIRSAVRPVARQPFVAGLAADPEMPAQRRHALLALQARDDQAEPLIHDAGLLPRHGRTSRGHDETCHPCLRSKLSTYLSGLDRPARPPKGKMV